MTETRDTAAPPDERTIRRAVAGAAMGNAVEWFDYGIYSYLATTIGLNFFPDADETARLLLVFAGVAIPFVLRPFGGIILGPLGDRYGRRRVLSFTIIMMSAATFCIGLIPGYQTIGIAAPILLLVARLAQGFSTGGEYGGAATFIAEYAPDRRRGFYGSFLEFGTLAGNVAGALLATAVQLGLSEAALNSWGWRIPFLVAGPLGLIGWYLRTRLADTPAFERAERAGATSRVPLKETLTTMWPQMLNLIGFVILLNVAMYTLITYMPTYLIDVLELGETASLLIPLSLMVAMMFVINAVGSLSDRVGRKPLLLTAAFGFLALSWPAIALLETRNILAAIAGMAVLSLLLVLMLGTIGSALPAMFPTRNRYSGFAIGYSTSTAAFGSTAPLVITALIDGTGNTTIPAYYLMAAAAIAIVPILLMPETARVSISHPTRIPGRSPITASEDEIVTTS
ncbi:glycine betaine/L-proline transporter ProP [Amycolatopsis endophytica]|uniref:Putative proline/betaine transporter n=1 Tax=Amycolatopsis endophytica TaxID=860233 RepID=A0A853BDM5_9PSEU|nr:MFS transporter [Amycolatopsis endophytica]NYI93349.1 MHS family proline/betaine transporter-like MFS transporter [Amycolatopsis endophytica]